MIVHDCQENTISNLHTAVARLLINFTDQSTSKRVVSHPNAAANDVLLLLLCNTQSSVSNYLCITTALMDFLRFYGLNN